MPHVSRVTLHPDRYPVCDCYPFCLPVLQQTPFVDLSTPVTLFVGENGTGKSTLLKAIARRCSIHIWENEGVARLTRNRYVDQLYQFVEVPWVNGAVPGSFFAAEIFREFAELVEQWAVSDPAQLKHFGGKSLVSQSHGQSLLSFFRARYRIEGLYLLDEPETALSPRSQVEFVRLVVAMAGAGHAQFVICTHSPILLACPGAALCSFDGDAIHRVAYRETDHYRVYRDFLADPEASLGAA